MDPTKTRRSVESPNGEDDIRVEEFIETVKFARNRTFEQPMLLRMIIAEKIIEQAKKDIRFFQVNIFEDLYEVLRTQLSTPSTISGSRSRMQQIRQG